MERSLLWGAAALGGVGWLCCLLLARPPADSAEKTGIPRFALAAAVALILIGHLITMPSSPPFARGHGWGIGFLIGGVAALIGAWGVYRRGAASHPAGAAAALSAAFFIALPAAVAPLLFMRATVIDSLLGVAIGWVAVSILLYALADTRNPIPATLLPAAAFAATLCGMMALAVFRGAGIYQEFRWAAAAAVIAAGVPLLVFLSALPDALYTAIALRLPLSGMIARATGSVLTTEEARESTARGVRIVISAALLLGLAFLVSRKVVEQSAIVTVTAIGIIAALAAWWLLRDTPAPEPLRSGAPEEVENDVPGPAPNAPLAVLVLLAAIMTSYQMLAGFGVGLAVLAAWLVGGIASAPRPGGRAGETAAGLTIASTLAFAAVFVVYRVAAERFRDDLRGVSLADHYALFGFVFGLLVPSLLARFQAAVPKGSEWKTLARLAITGLLLLAAPAAIVLVWGQKTLLTFLFGLALAASPAFRGAGVVALRRQGLTALLATATALAVAQWTHLALPLAAYPRSDKLRILAWTVGIAVLLLIASELGSRFRSRSRSAAESA